MIKKKGNRTQKTKHKNIIVLNILGLMDKKDIIAKMNAYAANTMVEKLGIDINTSHLRHVSDGWVYGKVTPSRIGKSIPV